MLAGSRQAELTTSPWFGIPLQCLHLPAGKKSAHLMVFLQLPAPHPPTKTQGNVSWARIYPVKLHINIEERGRGRMLRGSETDRYRMKLHADRNSLELEGNRSHWLLLCKKPEKFNYCRTSGLHVIQKVKVVLCPKFKLTVYFLCFQCCVKYSYVIKFS